MCFYIHIDIKCVYICMYIIIIHIYIYIYICMYLLFSLVKLESGINPSGQKSFNYEHLNFPGKELNITDITEQ